LTPARAARTLKHGAHGGQHRVGPRALTALHPASAHPRTRRTRRPAAPPPPAGQRRGRQPERARRGAQRAQQQAAVQAAQRPAAGRAAQPRGQRGQAGQRAGLRRAPRVLLVLPPLGLACARTGTVIIQLSAPISRLRVVRALSSCPTARLCRHTYLRCASVAVTRHAVFAWRSTGQACCNAERRGGCTSGTATSDAVPAGHAACSRGPFRKTRASPRAPASATNAAQASRTGACAADRGSLPQRSSSASTAARASGGPSWCALMSAPSAASASAASRSRPCSSSSTACAHRAVESQVGICDSVT